MNTKEIYIQEKLKDIENMQKHIADSDWLPEIPDEWNAKVIALVFGQSAAISIPFDRKMYQVVEDYFTSIGWKMARKKLDDKPMSTHDWWTSMTFIPPGEKEDYRYFGKNVEVRFNPDLPGSICQRRQIGERTEVEPIYEFACVEATK